MHEKEIEKFLKKIEEAKKGKLDLSADEDLSVALMNLISIEEHFFFTGVKTKKGEYFDLLNKVREIRKELLKKLIKEYEGEVWCISKHLLAASMRLVEVGTKYLSEGKKEEAEDLFYKAFDLYSLFWALNLKLIEVGEIKKIGENHLSVSEVQKITTSGRKSEKVSFFGKFGELVKRIIDCCIE